MLNQAASGATLPRLPAERAGVQPPRARGTRRRQNRDDLAREAVELERLVGRRLSMIPVGMCLCLTGRQIERSIPRLLHDVNIVEVDSDPACFVL
jgi:hypothetical protein